MTYKVLTQEQVDQFIERGFVKIEQAFSPEQAEKCRDFLWEKMAEQGVLKDDPATWTKATVHLKEAYTDQIFLDCQTERFSDAIEDLVGAGRWAERGGLTYWGWWPINFTEGITEPWDVRGGWHWDGMGRIHSTTSPLQGLLVLPYFSEVTHQGGGTFIAEGSHDIVSRFLSHYPAYPEGIWKEEAGPLCEKGHPWLRELVGIDPPADPNVSRIDRFMNTTTVDDYGTHLRVSECTAQPGDVYLGHPFLYHAASQNHSGKPRFMCNRAAPLKEPMNLNRPDGDYSPLETSIRRAISQVK